MAAPARTLQNPSRALEIIWGCLQRRWNSMNANQIGEYFYQDVSKSLGYNPQNSAGSGAILEDLPILYQRELTSNETSKYGVIYTPPSLASSLCMSLSDSLTSARRILDPACGSGTFLIAAASQLLQKTQNTQNSATSIASSLYGIDRDSTALLITRMIISTLLCEHLPPNAYPDVIKILSDNIIQGDALIPEQDRPESHWSRSEEFFDLVIGNPPYGLSRNDQLTQKENLILKKKYLRYRSGRVNKYLLFIARTYELLKPNSGKFCLIVPNAWLGIKEAQAIRQLLLADGGLEEIEILDKGTFPEAGVETVVIKGQKGSKKGSITISRAGHKSLITHNQCRSLPGDVIPTSWNDDTRSFIEFMQSCPKRLGSSDSPFLPRITLQAYAERKGTPPQIKEDAKRRIFHTENKEGENCIPYLEGRDITPFSISWSGEYLKYGAWLAEPQTLSRFTGPRILIREIVQKPARLLIASYADALLLYNKSILHILPQHNCTEDMLYALTAILQSGLISRWLNIVGKKTQRTLFPKIVLDDLREIPLPNYDENKYLEIAQLSRIAHKEISPKILMEIDAAVMKFYNMNPDILSLKFR